MHGVRSLVLLLSCAYLPAIAEPVAAGTLRVLTYETRPFAFRVEGRPVGIELEILDYFARSRGDELEPIFVDRWETLPDRLLAGEGDLVAATLTITSERATQLDFSASYFPVRVLLVEAPGSRVATLDELAGSTLATIPGTTYETLLQGVPGATFVYGRHERDLLEHLAAGRARAAAADSAVALGLLSEFPGLRLGIALSEEQHYGFALRPGSPLAAELDGHLALLKASGIYYRILEEHLGEEAVAILEAAR